MDTSDGLTTSECWQLFALAGLGRLALSVHAMPTIVPAHYRVDDRLLTICLGDRDLPPSAIDGTVIVFSVDHIDADTGTGWTVGALGIAERAQALPTDCGRQRIRLQPTTVTGRRIELCSRS